MKLAHMFLIFLLLLLAFLYKNREGATTEQQSHTFNNETMPDNIKNFINQNKPYISVINNTNVTEKLNAMSTAGQTPRVVLSIPQSISSQSTNNILTNIKSIMGINDIEFGVIYKYNTGYVPV
jgi:hypothetical protein